MMGRILIVSFLVLTVVFGVALYYFQTYAFYEETQASTVEIAGTTWPVAEWQGIDAPTSPLKLRACFRLAGEVEAPTEPKPTPLVAPGWFECFDAEALENALAAGEATAYVAAREESDGVNRIVLVYPDGRAFMWRQLNEKYADQ
jgi:hypothetical protein